MVGGAFQESEAGEPVRQDVADVETPKAGEFAAGVGHQAALVDYLDRFEVVTFAHVEVGVVVGRCHFHGSCNA